MLTHIHFLGIGGVGMAGLAYLLKRRGFEVSGCDKYSTPRTRWLEEAGIPVATGHSPDHLAGVDELIVTPAVPPSEPELAAARDNRVGRIRTRGEVLAELVNASDGIAVCGTHGKTTTATFTAKLLALLGDAPSWCIGGECGEMPVAHASPSFAPLSPHPTASAPSASQPQTSNIKHQTSTPFVVEADESDGTLALYRAHTLVITSMDYDHPEHFKTVEAYRECFAQAETRANDVIRSCELDSSDWPELETLVLGRHNVMNARAAIEVALRRGHTREQILPLLPEALSTLPDRRFQRIYPPSQETSNLGLRASNRLTVYTDYAHHPAELACAVSMAASLKPKRLRVLFQPHRHSRTKSLKDEFPAAFTAADEVVLIPVYPAFEKPIPGGDIADLYLSFRNHPGIRQVILARSPEEAWRHVFLTREDGDLVLLAGAGDIINLVPRIKSDLDKNDNLRSPSSKTSNLKPQTSSVADLASSSFFRTGGKTYGGGKIVITGMGSNSWFSDCASDIELIAAPATAAWGHADLPSSQTSNLKPQTSNAPFVPAGIIGAKLLTTIPGLAFMVGIPGTLGGWVKMNAGAFGHSISECIETVRVQMMDKDGKLTDEVVDIPADGCGFGYRTSSIPGLIIAVAFKDTTRAVSMKPPESPSAGADLRAARVPTAADYLARRKHFPPRTCGSVFKNPALGNPAGVLLEESGAKKLRVGGACVWSEHANVIVAGEGATSSDILALARLMAAAVYFKYDIRLEPEIRGLGDYPLV